MNDWCLDPYRHALLTDRIRLNSSNSSKPESGDPNRKKKALRSSNNKAGGHKKDIGTTFKQVDDPDEVETIKIDRRSLLKGHDYQDGGFEIRQVFDIDITRLAIEYRASSGVWKALKYFAVFEGIHQLVESMV